jgi:hypothetical protein
MLLRTEGDVMLSALWRTYGRVFSTGEIASRLAMTSFGCHCEERSDEAISTVEYVTELMPPNTKRSVAQVRSHIR